MVLSVCICKSNGGLSNFWPARFKFWGIVIEWLSGSPCVGCLRHTLGVVYTAVVVGVSKMGIAGDCGNAARPCLSTDTWKVLTMMEHADSWERLCSCLGRCNGRAFVKKK